MDAITPTWWSMPAAAAASASTTVRNGSATAGYSGGAMSLAAPCMVSAPEPMTTEPMCT
ncbi:MAG: hypothetical protein WKF58_17260 [Ilumatobacteraceae bacterium]